MITLLNKFSYKPREIERSEKKVYIIDTGFVNHVGIKFRKDYGHLYENILALELQRRVSDNKSIEFYYYKDIQGHEVDFVVKKGQKVKQLIQVCYDTSDFETKEREVRALIKASKELKCKDLLVITEDYETEEQVTWFGTKRKIQFMPLWKWLLQKLH